MGFEPTTSGLEVRRANPLRYGDLDSTCRSQRIHINEKKNEKTYMHYQRKMKVPPRFELGSLDSESRVLTITPWNLVERESTAFVS